MTEFISTYIKEIDQLYQTGATTEHSFRPALQRLLQDYTKETNRSQRANAHRLRCARLDVIY